MSQIIHDPQQVSDTLLELMQLRIKAVREHNHNVKLGRRNVALRTLVSEARGFIEMLGHHPLTACWAREWLERADEQLEEAPR